MYKVLASSVKSTGTWLLTNQGELIDIDLHVPSTTYESRGLYHLSCTDAQFLYGRGLISIEELKSIAIYCYIEYLRRVGISESDMIGIMDKVKFQKFAELSYAPHVNKFIMSIEERWFDNLVDMASSYPSFGEINSKWYDYICNTYCKVSRFNNDIEFRITSRNGFDWNKVIIDDFILKNESSFKNCKFTILKEIGSKIKYYFMRVTLDQLLEEDKVVLSSKTVRRKVTGSSVVYTIE